MHFLNAFWHGNKTFPKGSFQNGIVPLLIVFLLPYSKYKGVKICFYQCRYQNQIFSLVLHCVSFVQHSCRTRVVRVELVSYLCHTCVACVSLVLLVLHSCCIRAARVWYSCCKLDQIISFLMLLKYAHEVENAQQVECTEWYSYMFCKQLTERKLSYDIESLFVEIRRTPFEEYQDALHFLSNM